MHSHAFISFCTCTYKFKKSEIVSITVITLSSSETHTMNIYICTHIYIFNCTYRLIYYYFIPLKLVLHGTFPNLTLLSRFHIDMFNKLDMLRKAASL